MSKGVEKVKRVDFDLSLLESPKKVKGRVKKRFEKEGWDINCPEFYQALGQARRVSASSNISFLYAHLYTWLMGGKVSKRYKLEFEELENGNRRNYHPDVLDRGRNRSWDIEVKTFCNSVKGECLVGVPQLENYLHQLLKRTDVDPAQEEKSIGFNFAVFRYASPFIEKRLRGKFYTSGRQKTRKEFKNPPIGTMSRSELINFALGNVRDLIILPSNLMIYLASLSTRRTYNQENSNSSTVDSQDYFAIRSGDISCLHNPNKGLRHLVQQYTGFMDDFHLEGLVDAESLHLDDLVMEQRLSPVVRVNEEYSAGPIKVTRYKFGDRGAYRSWILDFRKRHEKILGLGGLNIRDLCVEERETEQEIPF